MCGVCSVYQCAVFVVFINVWCLWCLSVCGVFVAADPGEFLFDEPHYHADMKTGKATVKVVREHGFDGKVSLEFSTM